MPDIRVAEGLWSTSVAPEGVLEAWRLADGSEVHAGAPLAEIRIEDALHEIVAPVSGRLSIMAQANSLVEPGTTIGCIDPI